MKHNSFRSRELIKTAINACKHKNAIVTHLLLQQLLMQIHHLLLQLRYIRLKVKHKKG